MSSMRERMNRLRGTSAQPGEQAARPDADLAAGAGAASGANDVGSGASAAGGADRFAPGGGAQPDSPAAQPGSEAASAAEADERREEPAEREAREAAEGDEPLHPGWSALGVALSANAHGSFLLRRIALPLSSRHGDHTFAQLVEHAPALSAFHGGTEPVAAEELLCLDLETTGLGAGTGNVPFMVGLGFIANGRYIVEQMVIRHPAEERAMLAHLLELLPRYPYLVTYNGRTFDWPVLAGRFIMNGFGRIAYEPKHLDFLHPSRSIWRNTLPSLKLSRVEEERLGIRREDDLPGSLAPQMYFRFLADGNPEPLADVFRHNEWDMLALACLAVRFGCLLGGRLGSDVPLPVEAEELARTGLWLDKMGFAPLAEPLFALLEAREDAAPAWCLPLAARDKKCGNWNRAVVLWSKAAQAAERQQLASTEAHVELAMYHEHKVRNYEAALAFTESALALAVRKAGLQRGDPKRRSELEALRKRADRLRAKLGRI